MKIQVDTIFYMVVTLSFLHQNQPGNIPQTIENGFSNAYSSKMSVIISNECPARHSVRVTLT